MTDDPDPSLPRLSERYRVERRLGQGGMATVYLADDLKHERKVAVKVMKPEIARTLGNDRFLREIAIAARLNHPHVLPLFDSGATGDLLWYVTPYVAGESLRARLDRDRQLSVDEALRLTREILGALGHAHQHGIVHRDVKPDNILLSDGLAIVADFGIARAVTAATEDAPTLEATGVGVVLGTPLYMSPEQAIGGVVDARADLYATACVLFEMLAGEPPFRAASLDALLRLHLTAEPRPVTELRPAVSQALSRTVARGLAKNAAERYGSAAAFAEALAASVSFADVAGDVSRGNEDVGRRGTAPHNLPKRRTRFIGREQEIAACVDLLADTKLVTLTGIGGGGKTRLALEVGARALADFVDGVWFADLAPLTDPTRVAETVASALGVREASGVELRTALSRHVAGKRLLLLLDNCEHVVSACAEIVETLLGAGEGVRILATSREGLGIPGEKLFALRSLGVPSPSEAHQPHAVEGSEAVQLFIDRARASLPELVLTDTNAPVVAEICRRLDGIPLAIELAAARVKVLSLEQVRDKLDDRFRLLTGGSRTALPRHQTLQATIQWSYELLTAEEQRLLRLLSVFPGGGTLTSVTRVAAAARGRAQEPESGPTAPAGASPDVRDEFEIMDLLTRLVDKSLVLVERESGKDLRYTLLETVRQYARDRLVEVGEAPAARLRHCEEFESIAEKAYTERLVREEAWSEALEQEHDNLRGALEYAKETDPERYLRLAGALGWFCQIRSHALEGRAHLIAALEVTTPEPRPARARALWGAANLLTWQGAAGATRAMAWMEEALGMWRALGHMQEVALALEGIGWAQLLGGQDETARATFVECLRIQREQGDRVLVHRAMIALAQTLVALSRVDEARPMSEEIIAYSQAHEDRRGEHFGWHFLADCALIEGNCAESLDLYKKSLGLARALGDRLEIGFEVQGVAMSLAGLGDPEQACLLGAAVEAELDRLGLDPHMRFWDALLDRYLGGARRALAAENFARIGGQGRRLMLDEAVELALAANRTS